VQNSGLPQYVFALYSSNTEGTQSIIFMEG